MRQVAIIVGKIADGTLIDRTVSQSEEVLAEGLHERRGSAGVARFHVSLLRGQTRIGNPTISA